MSRRRRMIGFNTKTRMLEAYTAEEANADPGPQPIVCLRCSDYTPDIPSVRDACARCGALVWLSRETEQHIPALRQPEIWCVECMEARMREETLP
jgi:hypothetical protein